jgi:glucose/arabinose dehydrogenase
VERIDLQLEPVASGFEAPLIVTNADDGSDRLFVGEQGGRVWIVADGDRGSQPFLDVSSLVVAGGEQGLLGLAFHPAYEDNGRLFVNYTDVNGDTVVAEYRAEGDQVNADSERILLTIDQPFPNHNGGALAFGEDGYLYIATGDGGGAGDPEENGQDLGTLLAKLLRIDVDNRPSGDAYAIPPDNPFTDRDDGARPEIWAYGLRNPWRFAFDYPTDNLWIADVGQQEFEEIDVVAADEGGLNYGWNVMEGSECFAVDECDRSGKVLPVAEYGHDEGCSVTGGPIYRGRRFPDMRGGYFFGDYCSGTIWALPADRPNSQPLVEVLSSERAISSFGVDEAGEMYLTDLSSGEVLHLVDAS